MNSFGNYLTNNYTNNKPFNLENAMKGDPIFTRDGRKARIVSLDAKGSRQLVALVTEINGDEEETPYKYHLDGSYNSKDIPSDNDLMMISKNSEGWINIYNDGILGTKVYSTKQAAIDNKGELIYNKRGLVYVDTVKNTLERII